MTLLVIDTSIGGGYTSGSSYLSKKKRWKYKRGPRRGRGINKDHREYQTTNQKQHKRVQRAVKHRIMLQSVKEFFHELKCDGREGDNEMVIQMGNIDHTVVSCGDPSLEERD